jgi:transcriptional regulator with XRE-family HTH domain
MNNEPLYQALGATIREARKRAGLTQEELARSVSMSRASVTNVELGRQSLLVDQLVRFAEALQLEPAQLFARTRILDEPQAASSSAAGLSPEAAAWLDSLRRRDA